MLPPDHVTDSLVRRMGSLYHRLGKELGERPLVLPNGDYFPDPFAGDKDSVERLLRRMQLHAGLVDIPIEVAILSHKCPNCDGNCSDGNGACGGSCACGHASEHAAKSSCSAGSCGSCVPEPDEANAQPRLVDLGDGWRLQIPAAEVTHNVALTANLAKSLGLIFLLDTRAPGQSLEQTDIDAACEAAAVGLGFGGLLLPASYLYSKSCGGPRVAQLTKLSCGELAVLTVLFASRGGHKLRPLQKLLGTTQVSALDEAIDLFRSNPAIAEALRTSPLELSRGNFTLGPTGSFWQRWFKPKHRASTSDDLDLVELEAALARGRHADGKVSVSRPDAARDDLRDLVEEALSEATHES